MCVYCVDGYVSFSLSRRRRRRCWWFIVCVSSGLVNKLLFFTHSLSLSLSLSLASTSACVQTDSGSEEEHGLCAYWRAVQANEAETVCAEGV